jgi:hypothetical protein
VTEASQPTSAAATGPAASPKAAAHENLSTATEMKDVNPKPVVASSDTVEAIDVTIAVSMMASDFSPKISDRLKSLLKKYDVDTVFGVASAGTTYLNKGKGFAIELKHDWSVPFNFTAAKLPLVKFRRGEVGVFETEIYVKDGTEALVGEKAYVFANKRWTRLVNSK